MHVLSQINVNRQSPVVIRLATHIPRLKGATLTIEGVAAEDVGVEPEDLV